MRQMSADATEVWKADAAPDDGYRVVLVTFGGMEEAKRVVRAAVEARHAACGNLLPGAVSVYEWEGSVREDEEVLAILKTTADKADALVRFVRAEHSYSEPEVIALPVERGSASYLAWVKRQTRAP